MSRPTWATFDCYGTLVDWESGIAGVVRALAREAEGEAARAALTLETHELAARYIEAEAHVERGAYQSYARVLATACRRTLERLGVPLAPGAEESLPASLADWLPFPETAVTLRALRALGLRIAILSNVDSALIARSIERIGVGPDLLVTAEDAQSYKPAPGHWRTFAERSGASPGETLHVGASLYHDVIPASALGYRTVFINRHAEPVGAASPIAVLPDLRDLPRVAAGLLGG